MVTKPCMPGLMGHVEIVNEPRRLALAVNPRLLRETLALALRAEGLEVIAVTDASGLEGVDIAIVSEPHAASIDVPLIIRLPAPSDDGVGTVTRRGHASEAVSLNDVGSDVATLRSGAFGNR